MKVIQVKDEKTFQKAIHHIHANTPDIQSILLKSRLNDDQLESIVKSLCSNTVIKILCFSEGVLRDTVLQQLTNLLLVHGAPTQALIFNRSNLDGGTSVTVFANTLASTTAGISSPSLLTNNLTNLQFTKCSIGDVGAIALARGLTRNTTIKFVHLMQNNIGDDGACAIGQMLHVNRTIKCLGLQKNRITNVGVQVICDALEVENNHQTLKVLFLNFNRITCDGGIAIGKMLQTNDALLKLDVSHNRIGNEGKYSIMNAVATYNYNIESINVGLGFPVIPLIVGIQTKIHFYTDFNKIGQRKILKEYDLNTALWPLIFEKFGNCHKDLHHTSRLSILYHYIRAKPELFKLES